ncbi:MAG TPA: thermonuclease family protein [Arenibaculum sp.]|nr:thermonuclease family protein [Arenibaculum sp.]
MSFTGKLGWIRLRPLMFASCLMFASWLFMVMPVEAGFVLTGTVETVPAGYRVVVAQTPVRLWGIRTPSMSDHCPGEAGRPWSCEQRARMLLDALAAGQAVVCRARGVQVAGAVPAQCTLDGVDLGGMMVTAGLALDDPGISGGYYAFEQAAARTRRVGIWRAGAD